MQDLRSIPGGGRIFGGGDRRLRPYPNQPLKCPRCESLNTKFCYYNNYNLSQPRHFCKSCRRYWTKGGVLRNVPVGGGCRKTKRSKPKTSQEKEKKSNNSSSNNINAASHSSSESSSLTNTNTNATNEAASSSVVFQNNNNNTFHDARSLYLNQTANSNFEPYALDQGSSDGVMFGEPGSFTSLMTVPNPSFLPYNFNQISPFRLQHQEEDEMKMQELTAAADMGTTQAGCLDQTVPVDLAGTSNGELTSALDCWQSGGCTGAGAADQGLFDLPNAGDQGYWGQSQWTDNDHHLYLPP